MWWEEETSKKKEEKIIYWAIFFFCIIILSKILSCSYFTIVTKTLCIHNFLIIIIFTEELKERHAKKIKEILHCNCAGIYENKATTKQLLHTTNTHSRPIVIVNSQKKANFQILSLAHINELIFFFFSDDIFYRII